MNVEEISFVLPKQQADLSVWSGEWKHRVEHSINTIFIYGVSSSLWSKRKRWMGFNELTVVCTYSWIGFRCVKNLVVMKSYCERESKYWSQDAMCALSRRVNDVAGPAEKTQTKAALQLFNFIRARRDHAYLRPKNADLRSSGTLFQATLPERLFAFHTDIPLAEDAFCNMLG